MTTVPQPEPAFLRTVLTGHIEEAATQLAHSSEDLWRINDDHTGKTDDERHRLTGAKVAIHLAKALGHLSEGLADPHPDAARLRLRLAATHLRDPGFQHMIKCMQDYGNDHANGHHP